MHICIAGKNNIAIDVCKYVIDHYPQAHIYALTNCNDKGTDEWQHSYLKYVQQEQRVKFSAIEEMYEIDDLVFFSTEYDRIINPQLFHTKKLYNIHFSLLPAYKGMYPSVWPILNGEKYVGVTLHEIDQGIDTGDIIAQKRFRLLPRETSFSLYIRLLDEGTKLVIKHIESLINNQYKSYPQSLDGSSYYSKTSIDYANLIVDLNVTATQLDRQIRAFYFPPYQVAQVYGYAIQGAKIIKEKSMVKPGTIIKETDTMLKLATIDYNIILYKNNSRVHLPQ